MRGATGIDRRLRAAGAAAAALIVAAGPAFAGGFDIHEQSTVFLGSAMAGAAAGGSLGTMYWNPAGAGQFSGLNTESSYILVLPNGDLHVTSVGGGPISPSSNSGNIGIDAVTSSTYGTYRLSNDFWVGIAINSPFGLATKPENTQYAGSYLGVTSKLLTINANPMFAYRIAPGITVGAGVQMEWARGKLQFRTSSADIAQFKGDDWAFGATAGIMIEPAAGTSIGLGWRSSLSHDLDGHFRAPPLLGGTDAVGTVDLPDIVTLSVRQEINPRTRLLGTVQWENWSEFKQLKLTGDFTPLGNSIATPANWDDSWFFSVGGEYDYTPALTLRTGVGYEMSPVNDPTQRLVQIPDNDRVYLSIGASYKWSEFTTIDVGYSHIFIRDGDFDRDTPLGVNVTGYVDDASVDMFSVGFRKTW
jgi:long-chain fatty acid transport protein